MTYERYKAPFGARVWSNVKWYAKRIRPMIPEFIAGVLFGWFLASLPIVAALFIR